jgi:multiple sugar transport system permease protein
MRSLSLLPWLFPSTVVAFLWAWIFNAQYGVINGLLLRVGAIDAPIYWLSSGAGAMSAVIVAKTWATIPFAMAFFLAALQTIPGDQLDAARVDGAGNGSVMRHIVLPHVRYTTVILVVLVAVNNLQHFDIIYAMTEGGPVRSTTVLAIEVYKQAFQSWNIGLASAIGVVWLATIAVPAYYYLRSIFGDE